MASEIRCGDVDGERTYCVQRFCARCMILHRNTHDNTKCLCNEARLASLAKQDGELCNALAGIYRVATENDLLPPGMLVEIKRLLAERGVEL